MAFGKKSATREENPRGVLGRGSLSNKLVSVILAVVLAIGMCPAVAFALDAGVSGGESAHEGQVHVIVENTTYTTATKGSLGIEKDPPWEGTLVDAWVSIDRDSTMMGCVVAALTSNGHTQEGAENNYISSVNGLSEFDGGCMSGWMGTLNDWFTNRGFGDFTVANGNLEAGDEIRIMYTCAYGEDLGGTWNNSDTTIKALGVSAGTLSPAFDKDIHSYTLTVPADTQSVVITPEASNKNYQVRTRIGDAVYKRTADVPVENGTEIVVECNWKGSASMNESGEPQTYTITVAVEGSSEPETPSLVSVTLVDGTPVAVERVSASAVSGVPFESETTAAYTDGFYRVVVPEGTTEVVVSYDKGALAAFDGSDEFDEWAQIMKWDGTVRTEKDGDGAAALLAVGSPTASNTIYCDTQYSMWGVTKAALPAEGDGYRLSLSEFALSYSERTSEGMQAAFGPLGNNTSCIALGNYNTKWYTQNRAVDAALVVQVGDERPLEAAYAVTVEGADGASGISGSFMAAEGETVALPALSKYGFTFSGWSVADADGQPVALGSGWSFTMPGKAVTATAQFTLNSKTMAVMPAALLSGSEGSYSAVADPAIGAVMNKDYLVAQSGYFAREIIASLTSYDDDAYEFRGWLLEGRSGNAANGDQILLAASADGSELSYDVSGTVWGTEYAVPYDETPPTFKTSYSSSTGGWILHLAGYPDIEASFTVTPVFTLKASEPETPTFEAQVYVPKSTVGSIGFYKTNGFDVNNCDIPGDAVSAVKDETADPNYDVYTLNVEEGLHSFRSTDASGNSLGGGVFYASADSIIYLRLNEWYVSNEYNGVKATTDDYSLRISNKLGTVTLGDPYTNGDGYAVYPALIYVDGNALLYTVEATPSASYASAYHVGTTITNNQAYEAAVSVDSHRLKMEETNVFIINAPEGADVGLYQQSQNYNTRRISYDYTEAKGDGTFDYVFHAVPDKKTTWRASMEGKRTQAGYFAKTFGDTGTGVVRVTVDFGDGSPSWVDTSGIAQAESGTLLNVSERNRLSLNVGDTFKLRAYRAAWQITNNDTSNILIEPDFHYNVVSGSDVVSVEPGKAGNMNSGDNCATITALQEGVAVIEVSYDAIDVKNHSWENKVPTFGATDPNRTGVVVVAVGSGYGDVSVLGTTWDAEHDTVYFTGDSGAWQLDAAGSDMTVEVASVYAGAMSGWQSVSAENGVYNVPVASGNNVVRVTVDGVTDYQVVRAAQVTASIVNKTAQAEGRSDNRPGDTLQVGLSGLYNPIPKFAGIYNPFFSQAFKYTMNGAELTSSTGQYDVVNQTITLTIPEDAEGELVLTNGTLPNTAFGSRWGAHRQLTDSGVPANFNASVVTLADVALPDIVIPIARETSGDKTFVEDGKLNLFFDDCAGIGTYNGETAYYFNALDLEEVNGVVFAGLADRMGEDSMIAAMKSNSFVTGTNEAPVAAEYELTAAQIADDDAWEFAEGYDASSFGDKVYGYWIMDDDYDTYYVLVSANQKIPEAPEAPTFTAKVGSSEIAPDKIIRQENGYAYTGMVYDPTNPEADDWGYIYPQYLCDLYTVEVLAGTSTVDFTFSDACLAYGYDDDKYTCTEGMDEYEGGFVGKTTATRSVDKDGDGKMDFVQVQSPYDSAWNSTMFYAITFATEDPLDKAYAETQDYLGNLAATTTPTIGSVGGEWLMLALARSGYEFDQSVIDGYLKNVVDTVKACNGVLHKKKYTEYSRVTVGLAALGYDATDVAGYNLIAPLADFNATVWQGINGPVWALIAFDSAGYEIPAAPEGKKQTTRENLIEEILKQQTADGGWNVSGTTADPDMTAMAIYALAPYYNDNAEVKTAVDTAIQRLSEIQQADGGFASWGDSNSESCAQVIVALCTLGIDPATDERFIKDGNSVLDAFASFAVDGGGFKHTAEQVKPDGMASEQALYALAAYDRFKSGGRHLFDMGDVEKKGPVIDMAPVKAAIAKIDAIGEVTLAKKAGILEARAAYDALADAQKALVSNYETLVAAEKRLAELESKIEMYRLYNPYSGEHFYTADPAERDNVAAAGWRDEGVGWTAPASGDAVYRLYNPYAGEHHYTLDAAERNMLLEAGWRDEGVGWYSDAAKGVPLYRLYNPYAYSCNHNYTVDSGEHDYLVSIGWRDEGVAWYGVSSD